MHRCVVGIRADVAVDEAQRGHRHVEDVLVGVLEHQVLGVDAAAVEPLQPPVAADAVLHVHDRRAFAQFRQVAQQRLGIAHARAAFLLGGCGEPEHLRLGDQRAAVGQAQRVLQRADGDAEAQRRIEELFPALEHRGCDTQRFQPGQQCVAPARRLGDEQRARTGRLHQRLHRLGTGRDRCDVAVPGSLQCGARELADRGQRLRRRQVQRARREQRPLEVAGQPFVAILDLLPVGLERGLQRIELDQQAFHRQVVEQRRGALEEQRQPGLDAPGHHALADFAVDAAARRIAGELRAVALAEGLDAGRVGGEFARGHQADRLRRALRALAVCVEQADGFHFVVEQVDAEGLLAAHREQVDDRAAHRVLALRLHFRHGLVARGDQPLAERVWRQFVANADVEAPALEPGPRRQALDQRIGGGDDDPARQARQGIERREPRRQDFLVRREGVVRQHLGVGQVRHRQARRREEPQLLFEPVGLLLAAAQRQHRAGMARRSLRDCQRCARAGQRRPRDSLPGRRQRQVQHSGGRQQKLPSEGTDGGIIAVGWAERRRLG